MLIYHCIINFYLNNAWLQKYQLQVSSTSKQNHILMCWAPVAHLLTSGLTRGYIGIIILTHKQVKYTTINELK